MTAAAWLITMASEAAMQSSTSMPGTPPIASPRGVNTPVPEQFDLGSPVTAQGNENERKFKEMEKKNMDAIIELKKAIGDLRGGEEGWGDP